jgi:lipoprotein-releasing system permease protein
LNISLFISKHIRSTRENTFTATIHKIAVASIAIGLAVMIISFLILAGFQTTVKEKIYSFGGHLQVTKYTLQSSYEESPVSTDVSIYQRPDTFAYVQHVQPFSFKAGLLKTKEQVHGVMLKGVSADYDFERFKPNMIEGDFIEFGKKSGSNDVVISQKIANLLELQLGDKVTMYFIQVPQRVRRLTITGIYQTSLEDFDEQVIIGDLALIQNLNDWDSTQVGGFEIFLEDASQIDEAEAQLFETLESDLYIEKITQKHMQTFEWLGLLDKNVVIFLGLILFVACFNMTSILLIMIMERTQMIGLLKALGANDWQIRNIFVYNGMYLIARGMLIGNLIGFGFGFLQDQFKLIPLDAENYYMDYVPIEWNLTMILLVNTLTFLLVSLILLVPTAIIARIQPVRAIRFD